MAIRAGRERYYIAYPIIEDFTTDVTLRAWVGLSPLKRANPL